MREGHGLYEALSFRPARAHQPGQSRRGFDTALADKIVRLVGSPAKIVYEGLPEDDPGRRCPDISKARTFLQWEPKVLLDEGLARTVEYFRGEIETKKS